jgi:hypothetical protein
MRRLYLFLSFDHGDGMAPVGGLRNATTIAASCHCDRSTGDSRCPPICRSIWPAELT